MPGRNGSFVRAALDRLGQEGIVRVLLAFRAPGTLEVMITWRGERPKSYSGVFPADLLVIARASKLPDEPWRRTWFDVDLRLRRAACNWEDPSGREHHRDVTHDFFFEP